MTKRRFTTVHVDEIEPLPGPGGLTWRPVRAHLGIRAFGTNAYTADEAGLDVVERHTESEELAHEELYFVARGTARFTIDGETFDAPAGTYVFVPVPAAERYAVAAEPDTTVLSFGGPATFTPSAWEWWFRAGAVRDEDPERARSILMDGLRVNPESPGLHYELACLDALEGDREAALAGLRTAVERDARLAGKAAADEDFAALRDDPEFAAITSS
jgi:hypothetical protein